jgi:hypothetical protein
MILIIVPLILLILCYRSYVYNYCQNDMKCLKQRLIFNLKNLNTKLKAEEHFQSEMVDQEYSSMPQQEYASMPQQEYASMPEQEYASMPQQEYASMPQQEYASMPQQESNSSAFPPPTQMPDEETSDYQIEGFFGGLTNWFSGSTPNSVPVTTGTLPDENLNILEKKISNSTIKSSTFPPKNSDSTEFKDSDNSEILNVINPKSGAPIIPKPNKENNQPEAIFNKKEISNKVNASANAGANASANANANANASANAGANVNASANETPIKAPNVKQFEKENKKSLIGGDCQFFHDKCPDNYNSLGNFSVLGVGSTSILNCGNVQNVKPAKAIAVIKNNSVYEAVITDPGSGYNPQKPPKITVESNNGKGYGANCEAVIDDDGFLKIIKVINPGYNYTETPKINIELQTQNTSCHLCCKS